MQLYELFAKYIIITRCSKEMSFDFFENVKNWRILKKFSRIHFSKHANPYGSLAVNSCINCLFFSYLFNMFSLLRTLSFTIFSFWNKKNKAILVINVFTFYKIGRYKFTFVKQCLKFDDAVERIRSKNPPDVLAYRIVVSSLERDPDEKHAKRIKRLSSWNTCVRLISGGKNYKVKQKQISLE